MAMAATLCRPAPTPGLKDRFQRANLAIRLMKEPAGLVRHRACAKHLWLAESGFLWDYGCWGRRGITVDADDGQGEARDSTWHHWTPNAMALDDHRICRAAKQRKKSV